jgi:DNA end-binding protein Ku
MAFALIDLLTKPFQPEDYHDHYRGALTKLIDAKLDGKKVEKAPSGGGAKVIDLADALKKSLAAAKKSGSGRAAKPAPARAKARRKAG